MTCWRCWFGVRRLWILEKIEAESIPQLQAPLRLVARELEVLEESGPHTCGPDMVPAEESIEPT